MGFAILFATTYDDDYGISIMSGFGKITILDPKQSPIFENNMYYDNELSFQLSKPNDDWNIRVASESFRSEELAYLESKGYLDGIYVEKELDKRFLVSVFNVQSENFQLNDYISKQITMMNSQNNIKVPIKQISQSNDWALFSFDKETNDKDSYAEQLLFLKNNKLYVLQYVGKSPENLTPFEKSDFNSIFNSFEVF